MGKYFTVTVKPTIAASIQAEAAFADGDALFDWTAFDIPKGASKLVNAMIMSRTTDGTVNSHAVNLYFAKSRDGGTTAPVTIGTLHATANGTTASLNEIIGACQSEEVDQYVGLDYVTIASLGHSTAMQNLVLEGEPESGTNVGYDKLYVAGVSVDGTPNFASTVTCTGVQATTQAVLTVGTTHATKVFAVGDVLHDEDDRLLGTVKSVDSTTQMTMTANLANATVNAKDVYCINPITLILQFEK